MYCVSKVNEFYGDYGAAKSYYVRETANGSMADLFKTGAAHINLDTDRGAFTVTNKLIVNAIFLRCLKTRCLAPTF